MRTVLVFGTFDVIHPGHVYFLRQARARGDRVVASVARDSFVLSFKGRKPKYNQQIRLAHLLGSGLVDEARLSDEDRGSYGVIQDWEPDLICLGHDQRTLAGDLRAWAAENDCEIQVEVMPALEPERYKSSILNNAGGGD